MVSHLSSMLNFCFPGIRFLGPVKTTVVSKSTWFWSAAIHSFISASISTQLAALCVSVGSVILSNAVQTSGPTPWRALGELLIAGALYATLPTVIRWFFSAPIDGLSMGCPEGFRPTFFFASTTHARFIPTKHSFRYPLLYIGFPLTMRGSIGKVAAIKTSESEKKKAQEEGRTIEEDFTFFSVDPARYINSELPFDEKLDSVLRGHVCPLS